jgi:hypothetical protein
VIEIADPTPPADYDADLYYRTEQNDAPYVIYTKRPAEQIAASRWNKIKAKRDELTDNGGCLVGGKWYHSDPKSKQQWERMANKANKLDMLDTDPYTIGGQQVSWKTMDGTKVPLTAGIIRSVVDAMELREAIIFNTGETLKANLNADINTGWPARYEAA